MSIPLVTYNPNWEKNYAAVQAELQALVRQPYSLDTHRRREDLHQELMDAWQSQYRTTGEYSAFMEERARAAVQREGVRDFKIPKFSETAPVEAINRLFSTVLQRIRLEEKALFNMKPLSRPAPGEVFSLHLGDEDERTVESDVFTGFHTKDSYSYLVEKRKRGPAVCFFQGDNDGTTPVNCIELLASQVYSKKFGPVAIGRGEAYIPPDKISFYVYVPPRVYGKEHLIKAHLTWDKIDLRYHSTQWDHMNEVPYILRKQAFHDGLAVNPDSPMPPARGMDASPPPGNDGLK